MAATTGWKQYYLAIKLNEDTRNKVDKYTEPKDLEAAPLTSGVDYRYKFDYNTPDIMITDPTMPGYTFSGWTTSQTVQGEQVVVNGIKGGWGNVVIPTNYTFSRADVNTLTLSASWIANAYSYTYQLIWPDGKDLTGTILWNENDQTENVAQAQTVMKAQGASSGLSSPVTYAPNYHLWTDQTQYVAGKKLYTKDTDGNIVGVYTFLGWQAYDEEGDPIVDAEGNNIVNAETGEYIMPPQNIVFKGVWTYEELYTVTYDLDGGAVAEGTELVYDGLLANDETPAIADPTKTGYTFKGWTPDWSETVTKSVTYKAVWELIPYDVTYVWTDAPAEDVKLFAADGGAVALALPAGETGVEQGTVHTVDTTYTNGYKVYTHDQFGNNTGVYTFSGWDAEGESVTVNAADITISGTWSYEDVSVSEAKVSYAWTGLPEAIYNASGEDVKATTVVPAEASYKNNQKWTVDTTWTTESAVYTKDQFGNVNAKYTFGGWDKSGEQTAVGGENVTVSGAWTKAEDVSVSEAKVSYAWTGLPEAIYNASGEDVKATTVVPAEASYKNNQKWTVDTTWTTESAVYTKDQFGNVNAKYTFGGWDKSGEQTAVGGENVTVSGAWTKAVLEVRKYRVTYDLAYGGYQDIHADVINGAATPAYAGIQVDGERTLIDPEGNPTRTGYTFASWTPAVAQSVTGDALYTATWTAYADLSYTVNYYLEGTTTKVAESKTVDGQTFGTSVTESAIDVVGYVKPSETKTITIALEGNVIDFYYTVDAAQTKDLSYTVRYYQGENEMEADARTVTATVQVLAPDTLKVEDADRPAEDKYIGYSLHELTVNDIKVERVPDTLNHGDVVKAVYTKQSFNVIYRVDGNEIKRTAVEYNTQVTVDAKYVKTGYTVTDWATTDVSVTAGKFMMPATDVVFTATSTMNRPSGGGGGSTPTPPVVEELEDPDVPLANLPMLNTKDHVAYLVGREDGTIAPMDHITRGEVATIFFRLLTEESRTANWSTTCDYTDMDGTEYYNNPVSTATKAGLIKGYDDGTFGGGNKITRAEMATIAARFLSDPYSGENLFTDIDGHWASEYINRAAQAGWFRVYNGDGSLVGNFRPDDYITRAEVVVMINRMLERKVDMDHLLPSMKTWPDNVYSETTAWYYLDMQEASNSHDYLREVAGAVEEWTALTANPDWTALEHR
ncbi:MAG: S-layer homology domain-containing protein [Roseburia sp.]|nr:S-layer homology domain-containing protein [Roseburia sp.]